MGLHACSDRRCGNVRPHYEATHALPLRWRRSWSSSPFSLVIIVFVVAVAIATAPATANTAAATASVELYCDVDDVGGDKAPAQPKPCTGHQDAVRSLVKIHGLSAPALRQQTLGERH